MQSLRSGLTLTFLFSAAYSAISCSRASEFRDTNKSQTNSDIPKKDAGSMQFQLSPEVFENSNQVLLIEVTDSSGTTKKEKMTGSASKIRFEGLSNGPAKAHLTLIEGDKVIKEGTGEALILANVTVSLHISLQKVDGGKGDLIIIIDDNEPPPVDPCATLKVSKSQELFITNLSVVNDTRASWKFDTLISNMIPLSTAASAVTDVQKDAFLRSWLGKWNVNQTVNTFTAPARTQIQALINAWPKVANTQLLDASKAPVRLLAIVYRPDLKGTGKAGEGRFVFGFVSPQGTPLQFTLILEYNLPIIAEGAVMHDAKWWATQWHALAGHAVGSEAYKAQLATLTDVFSKRNAFPGKPVGNALSQLRTNEIHLTGPWELREFTLGAAGLEQVTVKQNPDASFTAPGAARDHLSAWMVQQKSKFLDNTFVLPNALPAVSTFTAARPLLGAAAPAGTFTWLNGAPVPAGATQQEWTVMKTNLNNATCSGCHTINGLSFLHVNPRAANAEASKSAFVDADLVPRAQILAKDLGCPTLPNEGLMSQSPEKSMERLESERFTRVH